QGRAHAPGDRRRQHHPRVRHHQPRHRAGRGCDAHGLRQLDHGLRAHRARLPGGKPHRVREPGDARRAHPRRRLRRPRRAIGVPPVREDRRARDGGRRQHRAAGHRAVRDGRREPGRDPRHQRRGTQAPRLHARFHRRPEARLPHALQVRPHARRRARRARRAGRAGSRREGDPRLPRDVHAGVAAVKIGIVAGEASGDLLGASLIRALKARWPSLEFEGIAGPKMIAEGARSLFPMEKLSVRGYVEVLRSLPEILSIRRGLARHLLASRPALFIGVDAPDFNLGLEAKLKAAGIATVHYVSPSLWAWRAERIHTIGRSVDRMLVMFPFEEEIYRKAGIAVDYVGHPLADAMPLDPAIDDARTQLRLAGGATPVALLPGSRVSELELHADLVIETARALLARRPSLRFFVPLATRETREYFERRLYELEARELPITILFGHAR